MVFRQVFNCLTIVFGVFGGFMVLVWAISLDWIPAAITAAIVLIPQLGFIKLKKMAALQVATIESKNYTITRAECLEKWTKMVRRGKSRTTVTYVRLAGFENSFSLDSMGTDIEQGDLVDIIGIEKDNIIIKALGDDASQSDLLPGNPDANVKLNDRIVLYKAVLENAGSSEAEIIQEVRKFTGANLAEAKNAVEHAPCLVLTNESLNTVEVFKRVIEQIGGRVEIYEQDRSAIYCHTLEINTAPKKSGWFFGLFK